MVLAANSSRFDADFVPVPAPRLATTIVAVVFAGFAVVGFVKILVGPAELWKIALSLSFIVALLALQLLWFGRHSARLRSPLSYGALLAQAGLVYLPILMFEQAWVGMPGFLAGSVLLVLRPVAAWPAFLVIVASMAGAQTMFSGAVVDVTYVAVSTAITGLIVYGLTRLATLVVEVHSTRSEMAQMAVVNERLRFARDLHDLLGYSLSAITLKSELTHRLVVKSPVRAREELLEILEISRQALADVRTVASGYRELSLDEECRSARSVLHAADVEVHMETKYHDLPVSVSTVLATVLREGVTNLLRHSKAERCDITVRQAECGAVSIDIANDGVRHTPARTVGHGGSGLQNLSVRAAELGGVLTAERTPDKFRLHVSVPLTAEVEVVQAAGD